MKIEREECDFVFEEDYNGEVKEMKILNILKKK